MSLAMCFCKIGMDELAALQADPRDFEALAETKDFVSGPNHRNIQMFHYILTGSDREAAPGIANIFADNCAAEALGLGDASVVVPDGLPKLKALLAAVDEETVARRWLELCAASGTDADPEDGDYFFEVLSDLAAFCDDAHTNNQTILWTWS